VDTLTTMERDDAGSASIRNRSTNRAPFTRIQWIILGAHVVLVLAFSIAGYIDAGGADGWADLARVATLLLGAVYLVAVGTVAAIARHLMNDGFLRTAFVLAGPPILIGIAISAIRNL
jgi:hypothetical protein